MPRGGPRPNSGPKPKPKPALDGRTSADREAAAKLIVLLNKPAAENESHEVVGWRVLWEAQDLRVRLDTRKYLYDKRDGKAVQIINHLHDKPLEVNHTFSIAEKLREARERAAKRDASDERVGRCIAPN